MKLFAGALLCILTVPSYAQGMLKALQAYQKDLKPQPSSSTSTAKRGEKPADPVVVTKSSGECTEVDQTSLPLSYISALMLESDGQLNINHDSSSGTLSVSSPNMISNCSSMIEWVPGTKTINGGKAYTLEAKIKKGDDCVDNVCTYNVTKAKDKEFLGYEKVKVKASMKGFEECLEKSGAVKDGKVVESAIYNKKIALSLEGYKDSGDVVFVSHGPSSTLIGAKYSDYVEIDGCDHYENLAANGVELKSAEQEQAEFMAGEEKKMRECGDYTKISNFIEQYTEHSGDLDRVRDALIVDAYKKAVKAIESGKYTTDDLKTIEDFNKYVIQGKMKQIDDLYKLADSQQDPQRKETLKLLDAARAEFAAYKAAPFITDKLFNKLEADGRFDEAAIVVSMRNKITSRGTLGRPNKNGDEITPIMADADVKAAQDIYESGLKDKREVFAIRTGQLTGQAQMYSDLTVKYGEAVQKNIQIYNGLVAEQYARMAPGGACSKHIISFSVQSCMAKANAEIPRLQAQMMAENTALSKSASDASKKAADYAKLEKEGHDYVAKQNGDTTTTTQVAATPTFDYELAISNQQQILQQQATYGQQASSSGQVNPYTQQQGQQGYQQQNMFAQQNPYAQTQQQQGYGAGAQFNLGQNVYGNQMYSQNQYGQYGQQQYGQQYGNYAQAPQGGYTFNYQGIPQNTQYQQNGQYQGGVNSVYGYNPQANYGYNQQQGNYGYQPNYGYGLQYGAQAQGAGFNFSPQASGQFNFGAR